LFKVNQNKPPQFSNNNVYEGLTWHQLFVKLDFEFFLKYFRHHQNLDFGKFIKYLNAAKGHIKGLFLNLYDSHYLKSGSYWVQALLTTLINLKHIVIQEYNLESRQIGKIISYL